MSLGRKAARRPKIVAVIWTAKDVDCAVRMRNPPDLFELRLDALYPRTEHLRSKIGRIPAQLIITARHPLEGGLNQLPPQTRCKLLRSFLPRATYLDVELRSTPRFAPLLQEAKARKIKIIISFHDLLGTPTAHQLDKIARAGESFDADIVKIATRTDEREQLERLMDFFLRTRDQMKIAVMGIGRSGRIARKEFARQGSILNYAHLDGSKVEGQLSIRELKQILG